MKQLIDFSVLLVNILMMMAVGLDLTPQQFKTMGRQKKNLFLALAAQVMLLPLLGLLLIHLFDLPNHLSAGVLLLAACPNGDIVNFYAWLARANVALAVTVTLVSLLFAALTMPLVFEMYARFFSAPFLFAVPPLHLILRLALMVALPVSCGMAVRHFYPNFPEKFSKFLRNASLIGVAMLIVFIIINQYERLAAEWLQIASASAMLVSLSLLLGLGVSRLARLHARDAATISLAFAARHTALAMVIAITLLQRLEFATFATVYFLTEVPLLLGAVAMHRRLAWA